MNRGVKQGDSMNSLLLIIMTDRVIKITKGITEKKLSLDTYQHFNSIKLYGLMYADNIVLITVSNRTIINICINELHMKVNVAKSKIMIINDVTLRQAEK